MEGMHQNARLRTNLLLKNKRQRESLLENREQILLSKELVTIQGGTVGAIFPDSGGSIFWIKLPAVEEEDETLPVNPFLAEAENQARTGT